RDEHGLLGLEALVAAKALHGREDRVVAATGAPARHSSLVVLELVAPVVELHQAIGGEGAHDGISCAFRASRASSTSRMVLGLIGCPRTSLQQSTSTSVRARSSMARAE